MTRLSREGVTSLVVLLMTAIIAFSAFQYPADSSGFPRAIAIFLVLLSIVELIRCIGTQKVSTVSSSDSMSGEATGRRNQLFIVLLVFASAPAYIILTKLFDFEVATFLYSSAGMLALGARSPLQIAGVSIGVVVVIKGLFFGLLDVARVTTLVFEPWTMTGLSHV